MQVLYEVECLTHGAEEGLSVLRPEELERLLPRDGTGTAPLCWRLLSVREAALGADYS